MYRTNIYNVKENTEIKEKKCRICGNVIKYTKSMINYKITPYSSLDGLEGVIKEPYMYCKKCGTLHYLE